MRQIYGIILAASFLSPQIGNACESNPYSYSTISKENWTRIQQLKRTREPIRKYQITSILGSPDSCKSSANGRIEQCIWIDGQNCKKKVQAQFRDEELSNITKSGS
jgi:hypothetical protein